MARRSRKAFPVRNTVLQVLKRQRLSDHYRLRSRRNTISLSTFVECFVRAAFAAIRALARQKLLRALVSIRLASSHRTSGGPHDSESARRPRYCPSARDDFYS